MQLIKSLLVLSSAAISLTVSLTINTPKVIYNTTGLLENLAIRSNGNVLVTRLDVPQLWEISPSNGSGTLVYDFQSPTVNTLLGITEYEKGVYAIATGTINQTTIVGKLGSWAIWKVDLRVRRGSPPKVDLITKIPEATILNGMSVLSPAVIRNGTGNRDKNTILVVDSTAGIIYGVSPSQKSYEVFYSDPDTMLPGPNAAPPLGVNGIKSFVGFNRVRYVYYTTTIPGRFYRVRLDKKNVVVGKPELLASPDYPLDDFALATDGTAYITSNGGNAFLKRERNGRLTVIGGDGTNGTVFASATSVALGNVRGRDVAYVTTLAGRLLSITL